MFELFRQEKISVPTVFLCPFRFLCVPSLLKNHKNPQNQCSNFSVRKKSAFQLCSSVHSVSSVYHPSTKIIKISAISVPSVFLCPFRFLCVPSLLKNHKNQRSNCVPLSIPFPLCTITLRKS